MTKKGRSTQIYRTFEDTDRFLIEVALDNYEDLFNEWDPAPFKRRDVDPDLRTFFEECSNEISLKHPLAIAFYIPKTEIDFEKQEKAIEGLRNFFKFNKHLVNKLIRNSHSDALRYFLFGMLFIAIAVLFEHQFQKNILADFFGQGFFIGGWLFGWEALSTIFFKGGELKHRLREWDRFLDAPIVFKKERKPEQDLD